MTMTPAQTKAYIAAEDKRLRDLIDARWPAVRAQIAGWYGGHAGPNAPTTLTVPELGITISLGRGTLSAHSHEWNVWPALAYLDRHYAHRGRPRLPLPLLDAQEELVYTITTRQEWEYVLTAWSEQKLRRHREACAAIAYVIEIKERIAGRRAFDYSVLAPDDHTDTQPITARIALWAQYRAWTSTTRELLPVLQAHLNWAIPLDGGIDEYRQAAAEKISSAAAQRHDYLIGADDDKDDALPGSCPAQQTALRSVASARQLGRVLLHRVNTKASIDAVVTARLEVINAINVVGAPAWKDGSSAALTLTDGAYACTHAWSSTGGERQKVATVRAVSPEATQPAAIEQIDVEGGDGDEIEVDLSVPAGTAGNNAHQADIYWVAGEALGADDTYVVTLQSRNDCGPSRLDVSLTAPPPSGD